MVDLVYVEVYDISRYNFQCVIYMIIDSKMTSEINFHVEISVSKQRVKLKDECIISNYFGTVYLNSKVLNLKDFAKK